MGIVLSKSTWPIVGLVCELLGWLINGIYIVLDKVGIQSIGISIILFTLVIYLLLTPIQVRQQKFSKMMGAMQPELQRIQKKYQNKKDQASQMKMNEETMAVYQKYGVSPMGSCLPMLIQFPILLALFQVIYHIPGYIGGVRRIFTGLVTGITGVSGYSDTLIKFVEDNRVTLYTKIGETLTENNVYDILYALKPAQWDTLGKMKEFSGITDLIAAGKLDSARINMFLGMNITQSPIDIIQDSLANGSKVMIVVAVLIPILAWLTQWLNYKVMPQVDSGNNSAGNTMKTMNTVMPIFSAFMCLSFSVGIGIYWIAGAVIRIVQQIVINHTVNTSDLDEIIQKNQEKAAKKREKAGLPAQKITQQARQSVKNIDQSSAAEMTSEEKAAARKASTEYYEKNQEYKAGSLAARANMVKQFDEKNGKKKK